VRIQTMFVETQVPFEDFCRRYFKIIRVNYVVERSKFLLLLWNTSEVPNTSLSSQRGCFIGTT
jgi:hypothetical protein